MLLHGASERAQRDPASDGDGDEPRKTGHDIHFLSRLERVGYGESDLALRLYRDPALVEALFGERGVPPDAERIAIPLGDRAEPPHVVVARGGAFVTCLGAEMAITDLPVVPFDRLTIQLLRSDEARARRERAGEVLDDRKATRRLYDRLLRAGLGLTREEFQQLAAIAPVLLPAFIEVMVDVRQELLGDLAPRVGRLKRGRMDESLCRYFWMSAHALGHLMLLTSLGGRRDVERWAVKLGELNGFEELYLRTAWLGDGPLALKAFWAVGRAGKVALPLIKHALGRSRSLESWGIRALALLAIAARHRRLRAEVQGTITLGHLPEELHQGERAGRFIHIFQETLKWAAQHDGAEEPEARELHLRLIASTAVERGEADLAQWVRDPLAPTRAALMPLQFIEREPEVGLLRMVAAVAALAPLPADRFYPPAADVALAPEFSVEAVLEMASFARPDGPVHAAPRPGRNDPCTCGSNKKYKRCCGT